MIENKIRAVIIDDEKIICELIKRLVEWDRLGIELVGTALDGRAALKLICEKQPDIVITDIRMPGLDGLELVSKIKELDLKAYFIIISGHKHFEYARNALKFGVEDYLLKPINKGELNNSIAKLADRIRDKNNVLEDSRLIKKQLEVSKEKLRKQFVIELLNNAASHEKIGPAAANKEYHYRFTDGLFQFMIFKIDYQRPDRIDHGQIHIIVTKAASIIEKSLAPLCADLEVVVDHYRVVCLLNYTPDNEITVKKKLKDLFEEVRVYLYTFSCFELTVGAGSVHKQLDGIWLSLAHAKTAVRARIFHGLDRIINWDSLKYPDTESGIKKLLTYDSINDLIKKIEILDLDGLKNRILDDVELFGANQQFNPEDVYNLFYQEVEIFFETMKRMDIIIDNKDEIKTNLIMNIENATSLKQIGENIIGFIDEYLDTYLKSKQQQDNMPIRMVKQYIAEHYADAITLEELGQKVHLNPVYLSIVFKKETGVNIKDYIIEYRLDVARKLLRSSRYNISEIALMVGYQDAKYFSKLFKKVYDVKPTEYRKLYS